MTFARRSTCSNGRSLAAMIGQSACTLAVLTVVAASPGCSWWNWRGKGFGDESAGWTDNMRPPADDKQFSGLDARAQEIERNLGVR